MKADYLKYWQCSLLGMMMSWLAIAPAFASTSDCKNPTEVMLDDNVKMKFCEIPAGGAEVGSERGEYNETPVKKRNFKSFQMGQYTVTQQQYKIVLDNEPWKKNGKLLDDVKERYDNPAVGISYNQAKQFAHVMNLVDSSANYRLPTEAELEYAARAGTKSNYYWGDKADPRYAYYCDIPADKFIQLIPIEVATTRCPSRQMQDVASCPDRALDKKSPGYCANGFGLMHMLGNVWQWAEDVYKEHYTTAPTDGNAAVAGDEGVERVMRGGSWDAHGDDLRSARRTAGLPDNFYNNVGFRLVRMPKEQ